jgi:hypothetical protein
VRRVPVAFLALVLLVFPARLGRASAGETRLPAPRLSVQDEAGRGQVWVEASLPGGGSVRRLLRETTAAVELGPTGRDPSGAAAFVTWTERGRRWYSRSRSAGADWPKARPLQTALRLHAGAAEPGRPVPAVVGGLSLPPAGRLWLVQFRVPGLPEFRDALMELGARVHQHLPHNAHLVTMDAGLLPAVVELDFVERVEPYHPAFRLEPALLEWLDDAGDPEAAKRVRAMALQWGDEGKSRIAAAALDAGARIASWWPSGHVIELYVDRDQLRSIAAHDDVLWIDRWSAPEFDMDLVREDAGTDWVETNFGYCGQGVSGEVLDGGIEETHMDFDGILLHGGNNTSSHGTSTYGIVFGNGDRDGDGNPQATGHMPCPEAQGISADIEFLGDRFVHTQELKASPYFASFQSNSWGSSQTTNYNSASHEMDDIIWRLDMAILQSQSNTGNQSSRPQAWAKNVISVGGIKHKDTLGTSDDEWTGGASIGPAADGRIKPDVSYWYDDVYTTTTGNTYNSGFGGTSAATPEAAGVAGLMVQMWADNVWGTDPLGGTVFEKQPHASTIKALLVNNSQQYAFSGSGSDLSRYKQGWGRPSARVAHERSARSLIVDQELTLEVGQLFSFDVDVPPGEAELKVTMHYPDPPGTTSSSLHRINVVTLTVTSPSNVVYYGNVGLDAGTESAPGGSPNELDTLQNVFVVDPEVGVWEVEVEAVEVNQDAVLETTETDVTFSLVVTGGTGSICDSPLVDFTATPNPARVGDAVQFDATASGGGGGPFDFRWDFDLDRKTDSTDEDPVHVFSSPYSGNVRLWARDAARCPDTIEKPMTVTGPDLRFEGIVNLTEVSGNANGVVDPGETWDVSLQLRNTGDETAMGVTAMLAPSESNPGPVAIPQDTAAYGDIAASAVATSSSAYRFVVGQGFPCGFDLELSVVQIASTDPVNVYPDEPGVAEVLVGGAGPRTPFHFEGFETMTGWSAAGNGEWQIAAPQGLGGGAGVPGQNPRPDPSLAFEGTQVMGNDLTGQGNYAGNYENNVSSTMTSPPIDASVSADVELTFYRWLNVMTFDRAYIEVSGDGMSWTEIYDEDRDHEEEEWTFVSLDVADVADDATGFRIRFGLESSGGINRSGWNVDAIELIGVSKDFCESVSGPLAGESSGLTVAKNGTGGLDLSWQADCGGGTVYGVYRGDLSGGYGTVAPEPGLCGLATTAVTLPEGTGSADFFLVVPAFGEFEGSYGALSGGAARPPAAEGCLPQDAPDACAP